MAWTPWPTGATAFPIGVVIPTCNRADVIVRCLQHLETQTWDRFEVIVVDDGSTDTTPDLLRDYALRTPLHMQVIRQQNAGAGSARNRGVALLRAPVCLLIGDDILASPNLVQEHLSLHERRPSTKAAALGLTRWSETDQIVTPFMRWLEDDGVQFGYGALLAGTAPDWKHFYTSNISLKTEQLLRFPFNEEFRGYGAEDIELGSRLANQNELEMHFLPAAVALHVHPVNVVQSCLRQIRVGESFYMLSRMHAQHALVPASRRKEVLRRLLMEPQVVLPALRTAASLLTRLWCPNPLLERVLTLHFKYGYGAAQLRHRNAG